MLHMWGLCTEWRGQGAFCSGIVRGVGSLCCGRRGSRLDQRRMAAEVWPGSILTAPMLPAGDLASEHFYSICIANQHLTITKSQLGMLVLVSSVRQRPQNSACLAHPPLLKGHSFPAVSTSPLLLTPHPGHLQNNQLGFLGLGLGGAFLSRLHGGREEAWEASRGQVQCVLLKRTVLVSLGEANPEGLMRAIVGSQSGGG